MESKKAIWIKIIIFLSLLFLLSFAFSLLPPFEAEGFNSSMVSAYAMIPATCALLTKFLTKEPHNPVVDGRCLKYTAIGWYLILFLLVCGFALYFLIHPSWLNRDGDTSLARNTLFAELLFLGGIVDSIATIGEEFGWRGYLVPKLTQTIGVVPATILTSLIWAVWHIPLLSEDAFLVQFATSDSLDFSWFLLFMFGYVPLSLGIGMILTFVSLKGRSSIPAAFGHAWYNRCMVGFMVLLDPERNEALLSSFSFDQLLYYCIALMFAVGIPMMVHLRKLEKQGKLTFQPDLDGLDGGGT